MNYDGWRYFQAYMHWVVKHGEEPLLPGVKYTQTQLFFLNFAHVNRYFH